VLAAIIVTRGKPEAIRLGNGPELTSRHFLAWALEWQIELRHIQPGKPTQNAQVESFHERFREECLRVHWFVNLFDARRCLEAGLQRAAATQQSRPQNASRVRQGLQKGELWERRRLRQLGKRRTAFPLCYSSGRCDNLISYSPIYGFWVWINGLVDADLTSEGLRCSAIQRTAPQKSVGEGTNSKFVEQHQLIQGARPAKLRKESGIFRIPKLLLMDCVATDVGHPPVPRSALPPDWTLSNLSSLCLVLGALGCYRRFETPLIFRPRSAMLKSCQDKAGRPWLEVLAVALMAVTFLVLNLATSARFPLPWQDEIVFTDVAVNLASGRGFISTVNMCGDKLIDHFWSCNAPLFPSLLGQWIKIFGFTILAVRSLNYVLILIGVLVLWYAVRRLALIPRAPQRLLFVVLLMAGYGMGFIYRSARYDCLGLLLFSLVLLAYSLHSVRLRISVITVLGILMPLAGIQLILYSVLLCGLMLVSLKRRVILEVVALGAGIAIGSGALVALFYMNGVLANFASALFGEGNGRFQYASKDPSFAILLAVCMLLAIGQSRRHRFRLISPLGICLACGTLIPVGMLCLGKFPIYYSWMAYVPLALGVSAAMSGSASERPRLITCLSISGLFLACAVGLPVQLASAFYYWKDRDYTRIESLVQNNLNSDDWVYTYYSGYFAVRNVTPYVFMPFSIPDRYRDKISVLVLSPEDFAAYGHAIIGGSWRDIGEGISDTGRDVLPNNRLAILLQRRINLRIYRRINPKSMPEATGRHLMSRK
jgi:hypothetical protein